MGRIGKVISKGQIYDEKNFTRKWRDKEKHVNDRNKDKEMNQDKEKTIWTRRIKLQQLEYYYNKDRWSDIDKSKIWLQQG